MRRANVDITRSRQELIFRFDFLLQHALNEVVNTLIGPSNNSRTSGQGAGFEVIP